jgi:hypothetical protein
MRQIMNFNWQVGSVANLDLITPDREISKQNKVKELTRSV